MIFEKQKTVPNGGVRSSHVAYLMVLLRMIRIAGLHVSVEDRDHPSWRERENPPGSYLGRLRVHSDLNLPSDGKTVKLWA
jgi:hypothetical protein